MRKRFSCLVIALAIILPSSASALDQKEFNKSMDAYLAGDGNLEKLGDALERYFRSKQEKQRVAAQQAEEERLEDQFKNPVKIEVGKSPVKGPADAKVTVIEFSDFQCPFCSRGMKTMYDVAKEYPKDVKIVFKHLPLPFHPQAKPAARASIAANNQGKFWEYHDKLFENQSSLNDETYMAIAKELGLDMEKFKKDYEDPATAAQVEEDAALATKLGVRGTPGFFVNGVQVRGAQPLPKFKQLIDRWLEKS